jgi:hypothetical protein
MTKGRVLSRAEAMQLATEMDYKSMGDWENDHRGDDTVQIMIIAGSLLRLIWFSLRDAAQRREKEADDKKMSNMLAAGWEDAMTAVIESGDGCSKSSKFWRKNVLIELTASATNNYLIATAMKCFPKDLQLDSEA